MMKDMMNRHRRPRRRDERGSAMVMALLVVIALTGLGLVGMKHTVFEMKQASNARFHKQALYTSETGMQGAMYRVGQNGQAFWDYMSRFSKAQRRQLGQVFEPTYPFHSADFMTNGKVFGTGAGSFEQEQNTPASFTVVFREPRDGPRPAGFGKEFCFKRFTFESTGQVGEAEQNLRWNDPVRSASARHVSHALVGPLLCDEGFGL